MIGERSTKRKWKLQINGFQLTVTLKLFESEKFYRIENIDHPLKYLPYRYRAQTPGRNLPIAIEMWLKL